MLGGLLLALAPFSEIAAEEAVDEPAILAPGWTELAFEPPAAGSYQLPSIGEAGDGVVVDSRTGPTTLHSLMGDKVVVMSFIYSSCSDANGCPLATHVLADLKNRLLQSSNAGQGIRFISLSFDPVQDTQEVMQRYGKPYVRDGFDWRFLTTRGEKDLEPILESYGQSIVRDPDLSEDEPGAISHVLRVYLIDRDLLIRNVYSASFLHADTMFNDILTLQAEAWAGAPSLQGPGDVKEGYERNDYETRALSLQRRRGTPADLLVYLESAPLGLPPIPVPVIPLLNPNR